MYTVIMGRDHDHPYNIILSTTVLSDTSAKIIQLNEWGCRDGMHHTKNRGNEVIPLAILSRILAQSCVTPLP